MPDKAILHLLYIFVAKHMKHSPFFYQSSWENQKESYNTSQNKLTNNKLTLTRQWYLIKTFSMNVFDHEGLEIDKLQPSG